MDEKVGLLAKIKNAILEVEKKKLNIDKILDEKSY